MRSVRDPLQTSDFDGLTPNTRHIYGHHLKVSAVNGRALDGPIQDTVMVPVNGETTFACEGCAFGVGDAPRAVS